MNDEEMDVNRIELWIAEHARPIFLVLAALIVLAGAAVIVTYQKSGDTQHQVDVLKPQVTKIVRAAATCSAQTVKEKKTSNACAARLRFALVVCRRSARCRAALLAIVNYPPPARGATEVSPGSAGDTGGGDALQPPSSHGHQPPGPGSQPGHQGNGQGKGQEPSPAPSPGPSAPPAHEPGPPAETPGKGPPASPGGGSSSGVGVEVCVLERTCVGVEAGQKGLLP